MIISYYIEAKQAIMRLICSCNCPPLYGDNIIIAAVPCHASAVEQAVVVVWGRNLLDCVYGEGTQQLMIEIPVLANSNFID